MPRTIMIAAISALLFVTATGAQAATHHHRHYQGRIASAPEIQDRYCLQGRQWGYPGNCAFSTFGQCMASASGTEAGCGINPLTAYDRRFY